MYNPLAPPDTKLPASPEATATPYGLCQLLLPKYIVKPDIQKIVQLKILHTTHSKNVLNFLKYGQQKNPLPKNNPTHVNRPDGWAANKTLTQHRPLPTTLLAHVPVLNKLPRQTKYTESEHNLGTTPNGDTHKLGILYNAISMLNLNKTNVLNGNKSYMETFPKHSSRTNAATLSGYLIAALASLPLPVA